MDIPGRRTLSGTWAGSEANEPSLLNVAGLGRLFPPRVNPVAGQAVGDSQTVPVFLSSR